jgi:hypothetical protein
LESGFDDLALDLAHVKPDRPAIEMVDLLALFVIVVVVVKPSDDLTLERLPDVNGVAEETFVGRRGLV